MVDGRGFPLHQTIVKESGFGCQSHLKVPVSAEHFKIIRLSVSVSSVAKRQTLHSKLGADCFYSLIVKDNVRSPDVVAGYVELFHPAVLVGVPFQLVVPPKLLHPQVGRHYLVLEVLKTAGILVL